MTKKAVLITGAAKRIGKAMALALAALGYDIAVHYNRSREAAEALCEDLQTRGVQAQAFQADLALPETAVSLMQKVFTAYPYLTALINNASVFQTSSLGENTPAQWERDMPAIAKRGALLIWWMRP